MIGPDVYSPEIIIIITICLWLSGLIAGFGKILFWTALVSSKQYRIDRFLDFLSTRQGLLLLLHPVGLSDSILPLLLVLLLRQHDIHDSVWLDFSLLSIGIYSWHAIWYFSSRPLPQLPRWHLKTVFLLVGSLLLSACTIILFTLLIDTPLVLRLAIFQILIPVYGWVILGLFTPLLRVHNRLQKEKIKKRMEEMNPVVITVVGSYGKSSTILYLEAMLQDSFSVLRANNHDDYSYEELARVVLEDLDSEHQVLITELQPTGISDISEICTIIPPIMTIVTEIDSLYENALVPTKKLQEMYNEALTLLPSNGLAILNRDDAEVFALAQTTQVRTKFFSSTDIAHVYATDITIDRDSIRFTLHIGNDKRPVRAPLFGKHILHSILAAATAATHLGVTIDMIVKNIETRIAPENLGGLRAVYGLNHALIIDNTNAHSLAECISSMEYASIYKEKNIIVIVPAEILDIDLCLTDIIDKADMCIITGAGRKATEYIQQCMLRGFSQESIMIANSPARTIQALRQSVTPNDVIVLQGHVTEKIRRAVLER